MKTDLALTSTLKRMKNPLNQRLRRALYRICFQESRKKLICLIQAPHSMNTWITSWKFYHHRTESMWSHTTSMELFIFGSDVDNGIHSLYYFMMKIIHWCIALHLRKTLPSSGTFFLLTISEFFLILILLRKYCCHICSTKGILWF